jgi:hypothetical protein
MGDGSRVGHQIFQKWKVSRYTRLAENTQYKEKSGFLVQFIRDPTDFQKIKK